MARTGEFIYLRTRGYLDIDHDTNQVRSFVCHNTLVDESEGKRLASEMKRKFAVMIQEMELAENDEDMPAVENPAQLERAIRNLITNLHSTSGQDEMVPSPADTLSSTDGHESDTNTNRSAKSPPLALIAPQATTIKTTISKSMNIVESASKGIRNHNAGKSPQNNDEQFSKPSPPIYRSKGSKSSDEERSVTSPSSPSTSRVVRRGKNIYDDDDSNEVVKIKEERIESRVPPLPTSSGYFEMDAPVCDSPSSYLQSVSSPLECKPFDLLQYNPTDSTVDPTQFLNSDVMRSQSGAKRQRFDDVNDCMTKRRLMCDSDSSETVASRNGDVTDEFEQKPTISMHHSCISRLTDPSLSEFDVNSIPHEGNKF